MMAVATILNRLNGMSSCVYNGDDFYSLTLEALEKKQKALSADDIKKAANRFFSEKNFITITMHPE